MSLDRAGVEKVLRISPKGKEAILRNASIPQVE